MSMDLGDDSLLHGVHTAAGTRRYRSKSQRPCDLCRARKVLCNIPDPLRPCQLCDRTGRPCTFVGTAGNKRRRTSTAQVAGDVGYDAGGPTPTVSVRAAEDRSHQIPNEPSHSPAEAVGNLMSPFDRFILDASWAVPASNASPTAPDTTAIPNGPGNSVFDILQDTEFSGLWSMQSPALFSGHEAAVGQQSSPNTDSQLGSPSYAENHRTSLDRRSDKSSIFIGYSNESDPFLLEHFPYKEGDEVDFFMVTYRKPSAAPVSHGNPPCHILQSKRQATAQGRDIIGKSMAMADEREALDQLVDVEAGVSLLRLYLRFVFQTLPIVSRTIIYRDEEHFIKTASPGLLAGVYALALPFTAWDEKLCMDNAYSKPSSDALWQIAYTCLQKELHAPRLSTVQIFLLLLNHAPFDPVAVETPFAWSLATSMLAIAQALGLHMDPTDWKLPSDEVRLRRRLWWAVVVEHSWRAITQGRPSLIHDDDWNVSRLTPDDFSTDATSMPVEAASPDHFIHLCKLTDMTNSICRQFFSLRAVSKPQSLEDLIESAKEPRQQLLEWLENLPQSLRLQQDQNDSDDIDESPENQGSLYVSYFTAHILILRALLRPIISKEPQPANNPSSVTTVLHACRGLMQTMIKFVRSLDVKQKSGFWPAYTRHCLCYPGLFCFMLGLQQAEPHMVTSDRALLGTWRSMLRTRVQSWPLLRFAIVKVDALFWKKLDTLGTNTASSAS